MTAKVERRYYWLMKEKYEKDLKNVVKEKQEILNLLNKDKRDGPFLLGKELDLRVKNYLKADF